jgi:hypothetical protein
MAQFTPQDDTWIDTTNNIPYFASNFVVPDNFYGADEDGWVKSGTPFPANDDTCVGLLRNDFKVDESVKSQGVVQIGLVSPQRLPIALSDDAKNQLKRIGGLKFKNADGNLDVELPPTPENS